MRKKAKSKNKKIIKIENKFFLKIEINLFKMNDIWLDSDPKTHIFPKIEI